MHVGFVGNQRPVDKDQGDPILRGSGDGGCGDGMELPSGMCWNRVAWAMGLVGTGASHATIACWSLLSIARVFALR